MEGQRSEKYGLANWVSLARNIAREGRLLGLNPHGWRTSNIEFSYRIVALRKNYEKIRLEDHTNDPNPMKLMKQAREGRGAATERPTPPEKLEIPAPPARMNPPSLIHPPLPIHPATPIHTAIKHVTQK